MLFVPESTAQRAPLGPFPLVCLLLGVYKFTAKLIFSYLQRREEKEGGGIKRNQESHQFCPKSNQPNVYEICTRYLSVNFYILFVLKFNNSMIIFLSKASEVSNWFRWYFDVCFFCSK